jgi:hypothetical protein
VGKSEEEGEVRTTARAREKEGEYTFWFSGGEDGGL